MLHDYIKSTISNLQPGFDAHIVANIWVGKNYRYEYSVIDGNTEYPTEFDELGRTEAIAKTHELLGI